MFKNRLEKVYEEVYKGNHKFYLHNDFKLRDLKEIFIHYRSLNLDKDIVSHPICYTLSFNEFLILILGMFSFIIMFCKLLVDSNIKEPILLYIVLITSTIISIGIYCIYNVLLKKGIRNFFDRVSDHNIGELINYMKIKKSNNEKENIIDNLNQDNKIKNNVKKRRL